MLKRPVISLALALCAVGLWIYQIGWLIFDIVARYSLRAAHVGVALWYVLAVCAGSVLVIEVLYYSLVLAPSVARALTR